MSEPGEPRSPVDPSGPVEPIEPIEPSSAAPADVSDTVPAEGPSDDPAGNPPVPESVDRPIGPGHGSVPRPGGRIFNLDERAAPGLYLLGWLSTLLGAGILIVAFMSGGGTAAVALAGVALGALSIGLISAAGAQAIQRRVDGRTRYDGPSPILVFAAAVASSNFLVLLVAVGGSPFGLHGDTPMGVLIGLLVSAVVNVGLVRLLVVGTRSLSWADMGIHRPTGATPSDLAVGALGGVAVVYVTAGFALLLSLFLAQPPPQLPQPTDLGGQLITLIAAAFVAPVSEEIFFRGFTTSAWARTSTAMRAIVQGAIFFAFTHVLTLDGSTFSQGVQWAIFAFAVRLPVSLALGWIFLRRRSIYASLAMHVAFNGVPLLLVMALGASR